MLDRRADLPFDFDALCSMPEWREGLWWPFSARDYEATHHAVVTGLIELAEHTDEADRDAVLAILGHLLVTVLPGVEAARALECELAGDCRLIGGPAELHFLRNGGDLPPVRRTPAVETYEGPRHPWIRGLLETSDWTSPLALPRAMLSAKQAVLTLTPVLRDWLQTERPAAPFRPAWVMLRKLRARGKAPSASRVRRLADAIAQTIATTAPITTPIVRERFVALAASQAAHLLTLAMTDLDGARRSALPTHLLSGTGGYYPSRVLGLEVTRRGGEVWRFEHGGSSGFTDREGFAVVEGAGTTRFVALTAPKANLVRDLNIGGMSKLFAPVAVHAGNGDPALRALAHQPRQRAPGRLRVCYACTFLTGYRKTVADVMPDVLYMDWQLRLSAMLARLDVDYVTKPHPEGIRSHQMLAQVAAVDLRRFEEMMDWADVFVFDHMGSSAFWAALVSDRPVVYVDIGYGTFSPGGLEMVRRRCTVIQATHGPNNRPVVDERELAAAVMATGPVDTSEIRAIFCGEQGEG